MAIVIPELENKTFADLAPETLAQIESDCAAFINMLPVDDGGNTMIDLAIENGPTSYSEESAGNDFWLTRNRHGVGFWDRGLGEVGAALADHARFMGEVSLYVGDDGKLYLA